MKYWKWWCTRSKPKPKPHDSRVCVWQSSHRQHTWCDPDAERGPQWWSLHTPQRLCSGLPGCQDLSAPAALHGTGSWVRKNSRGSCRVSIDMMMSWCRAVPDRTRPFKSLSLEYSMCYMTHYVALVYSSSVKETLQLYIYLLSNKRKIMRCVWKNENVAHTYAQ